MIALILYAQNLAIHDKLISLCRCIQKHKKKVRNKACVEGFIVEASLVEEGTNFMSLYFKSNTRSIRNKVARYDDGASVLESLCDLEVFQYPGQCISPRGTRELTRQEYKVTFLFILTNIPEIDDFFEYVLETIVFIQVN
jgi:hypothetical protein